MSLREIWRNCCFEYPVYCSLPLFGNVVLRHVLQGNPQWRNVTKVGDVKQKRYNLAWRNGPPGTEEQINAYFNMMREEKDRQGPAGALAAAAPADKAVSPGPSLSSPLLPPPAAKSNSEVATSKAAGEKTQLGSSGSDDQTE
jgi:hypothetical protein